LGKFLSNYVEQLAIKLFSIIILSKTIIQLITRLQRTYYIYLLESFECIEIRCIVVTFIITIIKTINLPTELTSDYTELTGHDINNNIYTGLAGG